MAQQDRSRSSNQLLVAGAAQAIDQMKFENYSRIWRSIGS